MIHVEYEVMGRGSFPSDMLRYDHSYPADTGAVNAMAAADDHVERHDTHTVKLRCRVDMSKREALKQVSLRQLPTCDRWASFGWEVVTCRVIF